MASSAAEQLVGRQLPDGWTVTERATRSTKATGGFFSQGYIATSENGDRAFLKALDLSRAFGGPSATETLQLLTQTFNFERTLCEACRQRSLSKIVKPILAGELLVDPSNVFSLVPYIMFELANGDVRWQLDRLSGFDWAWCLRCLHHVAIGLGQLHGIGIAHQDLKPSNILVFPANISKIADLGRAASRTVESEHDKEQVAGDWNYAPPELLYGYVPANWNSRRFGCDSYHLGSMVVFLITRTSMTGSVFAHMDETHLYDTWAGTYSDVLPYIRAAFNEVMEEFSSHVPAYGREEIVQIVRELCDPNPNLRGIKEQNRPRGDQFSLDRYVSKFDRLAKRAEVGFFT